MTKLEELTKYIKKLPANTVNTLLDSVKNLLVSDNTAEIPDCPYCTSAETIRYGHKCHKQRFLCKQCGHTFVTTTYYSIRLVTILYGSGKICYTPLKTVLEDADMPRYIVTLTNDEIQELKALIQKGGKGYRIKHAQILLKLDQKPDNRAWTYDRIKDAYGASRTTIAGIAQRFVMEGMEAALGRKVQENRRRKVTGEVEARICAIACSEPPEGASRWTMQAIADELIRLEVVDYITDTTVCEVMKKTKSSRGL